MTIPKAEMKIKFIRDVYKSYMRWPKGSVVRLYLTYDKKLVVSSLNDSGGHAFYKNWEEENGVNFIEGVDFVFVDIKKYKRKDIY